LIRPGLPDFLRGDVKALSFPHLLAVALLITLAPRLGAAPTAQDIVGTWTGLDDRGVRGSFVFAADGTADILKDGVSLKKEVPPDEGTISYRFDPSVTPHAIDIIVAMKGKKPSTLPGILEFVTADRIRLRMSPAKPVRPVDFSGPPSEVIVLQREKR
jgi:hypothetical protein